MSIFFFKFVVFLFLFFNVFALNSAYGQDVSEIHVFVEVYATDPALTQIIQYTKLPKDTRKIVAWHRFPGLGKKIDLETYNTREVSLPMSERGRSEKVQKVLAITLDELNKFPNAKMHLHVNMSKMSDVISPFLRKIPEERIERIHLYEDGYGDLFKKTKIFSAFFIEYTKDMLKEAVQNVDKWDQMMIYQLHKLYPATYYFLGWNDVQDVPEYQKLRYLLRDMDVVDIDFYRMARTLSEEEKKLIYLLTDFDEEYYDELLRGKKSVLFAMSFYTSIFEYYATERRAIRRIREGKFPQVEGDDYVWLYKPHPSYFTQPQYVELMEKEFPDMIKVPPRIPFEVFILADLVPTFVAGRESSLFYALYNENILFIIRRDDFGKQTPIPFLSDVRHVPNEKFFNFRDF